MEGFAPGWVQGGTGGAAPPRWAGQERAPRPGQRGAWDPRSGTGTHGAARQRQPLSSRPLGERLCSAEEATAGGGTYTRHGFIFSSLAGCLERRSEDGGVSAAAAHAALPRGRLPRLSPGRAPGQPSCLLPRSCPLCRW